MDDFTPGPWESIEGKAAGRAVVAPGQPKVRFMVAGAGGPNRDANARLIAAAPELLESSERLLRIVNAAISSWDWKVDGACDPDGAIAALELAIAKARGK